jgi:hypothetical protein
MIIIKGELPGKLSVGSKAQAQLLVQQCAEKLHEHYPHHMWSVCTSDDWSCVFVKCLNVSQLYGVTLHTTKVQNDPDLKCVVRAGGEILERGFLNRGKGSGVDANKLDLMGVAKNQIKNSDLPHTIRNVYHGF